MDYKLVHLDKSGLEKLRILHRDCFNSKYTPEYIKNKYNTMCFDGDMYGFFFNDRNGNSAAYYGIFPINLVYENKIITASQSGDTMTHPNHRGKGLFTLLAQKTYEYARIKGIKFVFGFTNSKSHRGFEKLGWTFTGKWCVYEIINNLPNTALLFRKIPILKKIATSWLNKYVVSYNNIDWKVYVPQNVRGYINKDANFFNYKKYSEARIYSFNGFQMYFKINPYLLLGDVSYFEEDKLKEFLETLNQIAKKSLVKKVIIQVSENHWLNHYLKNSGLKHTESPSTIGYLNFSEVNFEFDQIMHIHSDADYF